MEKKNKLRRSKQRKSLTVGYLNVIYADMNPDK